MNDEAEDDSGADGRTWSGPAFRLELEPLNKEVRSRLLTAADGVSDAVDSAVAETLARTGPSMTVRHMDWAYLRLGTVISTLRFGSLGTTTAMVARSIMEDALLWDWSISKGVQASFGTLSAAAEWHRLSDLTPNLPWLLPPGAEIVTPAFEWLQYPARHLRRLGAGAEESVVAPLRLAGLAAVNDVLEAFAHGNIISLFACPDGCDLPAPLAAASLHLSGAAAAAVVAAAGSSSPEMLARLTNSVHELAVEAMGVHGLRAVQPGQARPSPARSRRYPGVTVKSSAVRFPQRQSALDERLHLLLQAISDMGRTVWPSMVDERFSAVAGRVSFRTLSETAVLFRQELVGESATWNTPFAGRLLLELGAFWGWAHRATGQGGHPGEALRAFGRKAVIDIDQVCRTAGLGTVTVDRFLGPAATFRSIGDVATRISIPSSTDEMLRIGYGDFGEAARRMYRLLSQFVHGTGLAVMHLAEDRGFGTISEPMRAVAAGAFALGASRLCDFPVVLALGPDSGVQRDMEGPRSLVIERAARVLQLVDGLTGVVT